MRVDIVVVEGAEMTGFWSVLLYGLVISTIFPEKPASVICLINGGSTVLTSSILMLGIVGVSEMSVPVC